LKGQTSLSETAIFLTETSHLSAPARGRGFWRQTSFSLFERKLQKTVYLKGDNFPSETAIFYTETSHFVPQARPGILEARFLCVFIKIRKNKMILKDHNSLAKTAIFLTEKFFSSSTRKFEIERSQFPF
jgi:hypothetical protein